MSHEHPRLALVLGALSSATDLGAGVPVGTSLRTCLVATRLGRTLGLGGAALRATYFTALLRHLGCTSFSHEAAWFGAGDDHDVLRTFEGLDPRARASVAGRALGRLSAGRGFGTRVRAITRTLSAPNNGAELAKAQCDQASALAKDLGMTDDVVLALGQIFERYAGFGAPSGLRGEEIVLPARVLHVASVLEIHHRQGGRERALAALREQSGATLDPALVGALEASVEEHWPSLEGTSSWDEFLAAEPAPEAAVACDLDAVALAFARYTDLKTPVFLGHSTAVADLCALAGAEDGLAPQEVTKLRRAGLFHDLGIVAVPNGIWEKQGPFDDAERDHAHSHAFHGARVLGRIGAYADEARMVGLHHERCDGSGYPMGAAVTSNERGARVLACADAFRARTEARPHRHAATPSEAADELRREVHEGKLCGRALDLVLAVAGVRSKTPSRPPSGLTDREVDVLSHLARGLTNKEIAVALGIATKTAQHHVEHIYAKIAVSTRAAAALFAVRHDLVRAASEPSSKPPRG